MDQSTKELILSQARATLDQKVNSFKKRIITFSDKMNELRKLAPTLMNQERDKVDPGTEEGRMLFAKAEIRHKQIRILEDLVDSPYFTKCKVEFADKPGEVKELFFSKHSWIAEDIISWVSPISTIRFENTGPVSYEKPDGQYRTGELLEKENYIITGSEIVYLTNEANEYGKQLIFQKHLSERKQFALPEIVAELEKAQDQIIRSDPAGGFLITGSAGSGKTTLALHRVAYLVHSPEFREFFVPNEIIAFVADHSAISYFNKLLPELGIPDVKITTFTDWGINIVNNYYRTRFKPLHLQDALDQINTFADQLPHESRLLLDEFRKAKIAAIDVIERSNLTIDTLFATYESMIDDKYAELFAKFINFQKDFKLIDDIDIAVLLMPFDRPTKSFRHIVVDEVQNWLPIQLDLIQRIVEPQYKSVSYIGDIKQKTKAFTIKDWNQLESGYPIAKTISLSKVYRNTQQILHYLATKGYEVTADSTTKTGPEVVEMRFSSAAEQLDYIKQQLELLKKEEYTAQVGILAKYDRTLNQFANVFMPPNFHVLSIEAAQGLEFDTVFLLDSQDLAVGEDYYAENISYISAAEYSEVDKQLFYVAATRAENRLVVCTVT